MNHDVRMRCIDIDIVQPRNKAIQAGTLDKTKEPFSIRIKQFFPVEKAEWVSGHLPSLHWIALLVPDCCS
jgi:hypothetical protein